MRQIREGEQGQRIGARLHPVKRDHIVDESATVKGFCVCGAARFLTGSCRRTSQ